VQYQPNPAKFDGRTTSGDTYTAKPIIREQPAPLRQGPPSPAFDARSTSQEDYGAKPLPPRPVPAQQPRWESSGQFYGETESQAQFKQYQMQRAEPVQMRQAPPPAKFEATTTNQATYVAQPLPPREQAQPVQYQPNPAKFDGRTTSGDTYTAKPIQRDPPPQMHPAAPAQPFTATTTSQEDYGVKELPRREASIPQEWQPSPGKFYASTTYGEQFQGWSLPAHKPGLGICIADGSLFSLIPAGWEAPARASVVVTTVADGQTTTCIQVMQGNAPSASEDNLIGHFTLHVPPQPKGLPQIEVMFHIDPACVLHVAGRDRVTGEHAEIIVGSGTISPTK